MYIHVHMLHICIYICIMKVYINVCMHACIHICTHIDTHPVAEAGDGWNDFEVTRPLMPLFPEIFFQADLAAGPVASSPHDEKLQLLRGL